ncbi:MAG: hypothetical protein ACYC3L_12155 [Gemmatimonadaceae bacterium]
MRTVLSRRTALRVVSLAVAAAALTACYDDGFSPYWDRGTYYLTYANNRPVPATVSGGPGGARVEVTGGTLTLRRDHSYQMLVHVREWMQGGQFYESTKAFAGTYENDGREIYLTWYDPHDYYSSVMSANWRNGRVEVVVPDVDGFTDVLCGFED